MKALRFDGESVQLDPAAPEPALEAGWALIRPTRVGVASADLGVVQKRVCFKGTLGHEFVGVVERFEGPPTERRKWEGKRVTGAAAIVCAKCDLCRGGLSRLCQGRRVLGLHRQDGCFAERFVLPVVNLVEVPKAIDDDAAVFAGVVAAALHAAQVIRFEGKPYVTVLGDGPMGLLAAQVMTRLNASVRLLGKHAEKYTLCEKWGIKHRHISEVGRRMDQDIVVDCTGSPEGVATAMQLVRPRGKIILKSSPAPVPAAGLMTQTGVDVNAAAANELELIGAGSGRIADGVAALARGEVDVRSLVTRRVKFAEAKAALAIAAEPGTIRVAVEV